MDLLKVIFFVFLTKCVASSRNRPNIKWTCDSKELTVTVNFKKPFSGIVFTRNNRGHPNCSSPNMPAPTTRVITLKLPLLKCGNKVKNLGNVVEITNMMVVQYHPLIPTETDIKLNITCALSEKLPSDFWDSYQNKVHKVRPSNNFWVEFKYGPKIFGQRESELLGVTNKLFVVAYIRDGGKNRKFKLRKCISHDDPIIGNSSSVKILTEVNDCADESLSEFSIKPNASVSDLITFAEMKDFSFKNKRNYFITCAVDLCKWRCPTVCPGRKANSWSPVKTHKISKRSTSVVRNPSTLKDLERRNNYLRMTLRAFSEKLLTLKMEQEKLKNQTERNKSNSSILPVLKIGSLKEDSVSSVQNTEDSFSFKDISSVHPLETTSYTETSTLKENDHLNPLSIASVDSKFHHLQSIKDVSPNRSSTKIKLKLNSGNMLNNLENNLVENVIETTKLESTTVVENNDTAQNFSAKIGSMMNDSREVLDLASAVEAFEEEELKQFEKILEITTKLYDELEETQGNTKQNEKVIDKSWKCTNCTMNASTFNEISNVSEVISKVIQPMYNITDETFILNDYENGTNTNKSNIDVSSNALFNNKLFLTDCVSKFKFTLVTASLSIVAICCLFLCIGFYLTLKKQKKKHAYDTLLLYSPF